MHLGFFPTEEYAARSYDRAAINKGAKETCGKIVTNFEITDYTEEFDVLRRVSQEDLVFALSTERSAQTSDCMMTFELVSTGTQPLDMHGCPLVLKAKKQEIDSVS